LQNSQPVHKLFRVEFLKDSPILPDFLAEVLKTHSVRQQIEAGATGTSPTMKNISKSALLELTFSVPTGPDGLKIQERMISNLEAARLDVRDLRAQAAKARTAAWGEFLAAIFE
jgi:type I restriction enzyme S subunit